MVSKKHHAGITFLNILIFFTAILMHGNFESLLYIEQSKPFILLALLTAYSTYSKFGWAAFAGALSGAFVDSTASGSYCFNTIGLMLLAALVCLLSNSVFNKNLKAAAVLCFIVSMIYFLTHWLILIAFKTSAGDNIEYLLQTALPNSLYTTVFILPFYFLYKHWNKKRNEN
ncbi:MAG: hypothetical protein ACOYJS_00830 [Acutalibacteraceae bacterium]